MTNESVEGTALSATQNAYQIMVVVTNILISQVATRKEWLFNVRAKFTLTQVQSGGLGNKKVKAAMDLVSSYPGLLSAQLIQELSDLKYYFTCTSKKVLCAYCVLAV